MNRALASISALLLVCPLAAVSQTLPPSRGGTGVSTAPSYGQLLLGNSSGGYTLAATSSLGIDGEGGLSFEYLFPSNATSTLLTFSGGLLSIGSTTIVGNATTTGMFGLGSLFINSERFTDLTGAGLMNTGGALTLDASGDWTGTFDGRDGSAYLSDAFSTTSASYFSGLGLAFSTTSSDHWKSITDFFSTTSAAYFSSLGLAFSTTSSDYWETQQPPRGITAYDAWTHPQTGTSATTSGMLFSSASSTFVGALRAGHFFGNLTGQASTSLALAANGTNCSAGSYPLGMDASGNVENCTDATTEINSAIATHAADDDAHHAPITLAGAPDYITLSGQQLTRNAIDLAADVTGTLPVTNGGTGATTLNNLITLATHTVGNYLATLTSSGSITVGNSGTENAAATVNLNMANANTWTALQTFGNASSTLFSTSYASSTFYYGGGLATCQSGNFLTWTNGQFGCAADQTGGGGNEFDYPFPSNATSTPLTFSGGLSATNASTTHVSASGQFFGKDGSSASPSFTFSNDTDTGIWGDGALNFGVNGTHGLTMTAAGILPHIGIFSQHSGSASEATYSFLGDANTGMYRSAADTLNLLAGGADALVVRTSGASTTNLTVGGYASSTLYYGAGLANCNTGNMLTWTDGQFGCEDDSTGGGGAAPFTWATTYGSVHAATSSNLWAQGILSASSTVYLDKYKVTNHAERYLDFQNNSGDPYSLLRIVAPAAASDEATLSLVIDKDDNNDGTNEEFVDVYNENYADSVQSGFRQGYSGTGVAKPIAFGHWSTVLGAGGKDIGNKLLLMPSGTVGVAQATSTLNLTSTLHVASSSAATLLRVDAAPGANKFLVSGNGAVDVPAGALSVTGNININGGNSIIPKNASDNAEFYIFNNGGSGANQLYISDFTDDLQMYLAGDVQVVATTTTTGLNVTGAVSFLGEYFTNFTTYVRSLFSGGTGITLSSGVISFDCSEVEGDGIDCVGENITLDTTGLLSTASILDDLAQTSLTDPNADRLVFWDDSDTAFEFITSLVGLAISGNTLTVNDVSCTDCLNATEIEDIFLLNAGDSSSGNYTWTGNQDFGGANFLEIPNGTNPTANDPGELAHDTTDNQLILDDFVVGRATERIWGATIASTSPAFISGGLFPVPTQLDGYTITRIQCHVVSGTSKVIAVEDASGNSSEDITCGTTNTTDDGSITNAAYTASELAFIDFGATSGSVDYVSISVFGTWTRE